MKLLDEKRGAVHRVVTVRLHDHIFKKLEREALKAGSSVSDFLRRLINEKLGL